MGGRRREPARVWRGVLVRSGWLAGLVLFPATVFPWAEGQWTAVVDNGANRGEKSSCIGRGFQNPGDGWIDVIGPAKDLASACLPMEFQYDERTWRRDESIHTGSYGSDYLHVYTTYRSGVWLTRRTLTSTLRFNQLPAGETPPQSDSPREGKNNGKPEQCSAEVGNPVNVATGNKFHQEQDLRFDSPAITTFSRYYNSMGSADGRLGKKWRHTYDRQVELDAGGAYADVHRADGKVLRFTSVAGSWVPDADIAANLAWTGNGWQYTDRDDVVEYYDAHGSLTGIAYPDGRSLTVEYDGNTISRVTDSMGTELLFAYVAERLENVTAAGRTWHYGYDAAGNLAQVENPDGTIRQYHYDDPNFPNHLTGITDERGVRYAVYAYDDQGRAILTTHAGDAERVDIAYTSNETRMVTDSRGNASTYRVAEQLGSALVTDIDGPGCSTCGTGERSYTHDEANNVTFKTEHGRTTEYGDYDSHGNPGYIIEAAGTPQARRIDFTYDPRFQGKVATRTEASVYADAEKVTTYSYDDHGNVTEETIQGYRPDGTEVSHTTRYSYDGPLNQLTRIAGPRTDVADTTTLEYYPNDPAEGVNRGRLKRVVDPTGLVLRDNIQYSATGKVVSEVRPNGVTLSYTYYFGNDRLESLTEAAAGETRTTRWTYLPTGEVASITRGYGTSASSTLTLGYDAARRLTSVTDGLGNSIEYTLDTEGNRTGEQVYDSAGRLSRALEQIFDVYNRLDTSSRANEDTRYEFDPDGTLAREIDGRGTIIEYDYDALQRMISSTRDLDGINATADHTYDVADRLTAVTDPNGNTTSYVYDDLGNRLVEASPDAGTTTYTYDEAGNVLTRTDAKGQTTAYRYDEANRLVEATYADGTRTAYAYDTTANGAGRLGSITDPSGRTEWTYTPFGEVSTKRQQIGGHSFTVSYAYDAAGNLTHLTYPSGKTVAYGYREGRTRSISVDGVSLATDIRHAPFGRVAGWTWGRGGSHEREYDLAGRTRAHDLAGDTRRLDYDPAGNIVEIADSRVRQVFDYDALSRLTEANDADFHQRFVYDANGNRLELSEADGPTTYRYSADSNRLLEVVAETRRDYQYDANGNTVHDGRHTYTYNARNRLVAVDGGRTAKYDHNALGQRVYKEVPVPGDANGDGIIDQNDIRAVTGRNADSAGPGADCNGDRVVNQRDVPCIAQKMAAEKSGKADRRGGLGEEDTSGPTTEPKLYFVYDEQGQLIGEYDQEGNAVREIVWLDNLPIGLLTTGSLHHIHPDHLGTPRAITDQTGTVVWRWDSDPFGTTAANDDPGGDGRRLTFNLRFPGQYFDAETGLHYNYFRDYDPNVGRYITSDPIGISGGLNLYRYAGNRPVTVSDLMGLSPGLFCGTCAPGPGGDDCRRYNWNLCRPGANSGMDYCCSKEYELCMSAAVASGPNCMACGRSFGRNFGQCALCVKDMAEAMDLCHRQHCRVKANPDDDCSDEPC